MGDIIVQRSQAGYETVPDTDSIDLLLETMNRPGLRRLGRGTLMGNKEHKLQVNLELTHLKRKVKSRVSMYVF